LGHEIHIHDDRMNFAAEFSDEDLKTPVGNIKSLN
jgi:hypothetical protein